MTEEQCRIFFKKALDYTNQYKSKELDRIRNITIETFLKMNERNFLSEYCWAVFVAHNKVDRINKRWSEIEKSFRYFNPKELCDMNIEDILEFLKIYKTRTTRFFNGAKKIHDEGFENYKNRAIKDGMRVFIELPGIGKAGSQHLAKNTGLKDTGKCDQHVKNIIEIFKLKDMNELFSFLSSTFNEDNKIIDEVIWQFCSNKAWESYGYDTLDEFLKNM